MKGSSGVAPGPRETHDQPPAEREDGEGDGRLPEGDAELPALERAQRRDIELQADQQADPPEAERREQRPQASGPASSGASPTTRFTGMVKAMPVAGSSNRPHASWMIARAWFTVSSSLITLNSV